ncbi:hypothetical protein FoTM2_010736 [Fusarium oxysporum f. sp. vasinfectum]|nr:hypothetical protein FoTM2_010736 [Fusarium oxysporum f. sp. vasinfectum]
MEVSVGQPPHDGIQSVDLGGEYVCPGLIDDHVHVTATTGEVDLKSTCKNIPALMNNFRTTFLAREMLQRGFTTARDCGGADGSLKDAIDEWLIAGHALSQTGGHGDQRATFSDEDPTTKCCAGHRSDEIRKSADFIKVMSGGGVASRLNNLAHPQFLDEELSAMVHTTASYDTYVTAHAYTIRAMRHMINNGVLGIEHGNFLDEDLAELMAAKGIYLTPTLVTHDAIATPPYDQFLNEDFAYEAGVTTCFGSDLIAGTHQFQRREFTIRSQVLPLLAILRSATINCAKMMRREDRIGQIKKGFMADMVVLTENPLVDITVLDSKEKLLAEYQARREWLSGHENQPRCTSIGTYDETSAPKIPAKQAPGFQAHDEESIAIHRWPGAEGEMARASTGIVPTMEAAATSLSIDWDQFFPQNLLNGWEANERSFWLLDPNNNFDVL